MQPAPTAVDSRPWIAAFTVLGIILILLLWFPVSRLTSHYQLGYNEGFNTYFQAAASGGAKIYGDAPSYVYANYPPLSFHVVGLIGRITGDINVAGRIVAFLAYLSIGVWISLITYALTSKRQLAAYAGLCWLIWIPAFDIMRMNLNDPHLLGMSIALAGLYCYLRNPESPRWLVASAVLFSLALFTKQSLIAMPAGVAVHLFLTAKKRLVLWLGAAIGASVVLLLATFALDGRFFLDHLNLPRPYYFYDIWSSTIPYLTFAQVAFCAALVLILRAGKSGLSGVLIWAFIVANVAGAFYCGGAGAGINHFFDALALLAIFAALSVPSIERLLDGVRYRNAAFVTLLIVPFFLSSLAVLPRRIPADFSHRANERQLAETEFAESANLVRTVPGPALCENLLLCYAAGKPELYDPFVADMMMRTGKISPDQVAQLIRDAQFAVIEIDFDPQEVVQVAPRTRFPGPVMRALYGRYQLIRRTPHFAIFTPRPQ